VTWLFFSGICFVFLMLAGVAMAINEGEFGIKPTWTDVWMWAFICLMVSFAFGACLGGGHM